MARLGGFWSYTHADDVADFGRVADLARDIASQYEMLTGERIDLFLDRDSLEWGSAWSEEVDGSLATVAFFIPVLTPRYFQSPECRRELRTFAAQAERLGLSELLLPLLYVDFPGLGEEQPADELIALVKKYHWATWTELRFAERTSGEYRLGVSNLAARLVAVNVEAGKPSTLSTLPTGDLPSDEEPGLMDRMAEAEQALPDWAETVQRIG